ncbi:stage III sporulation protein AF [Oscillospiraceae bacterium MB08-C2-2]|nr:stage III sporulation protein AF [Oscillospiraceae bacterium MB08-C2-2]
MEAVKEWAFSLCAAMVACGIGQMVLPKSNLEKLFRLTVSVFFLCCLLTPFFLRGPGLALDVEIEALPDIGERAARLEQVLEEQSQRQITTSMEKIIQDKLQKMGINYHTITINITTNGQNDTQVDGVKLTLEKQHQASGPLIQKTLENELGLAVELEYQ